jgi:hypothetical protein
MRMGLGSVTVDLGGMTSFAALPGGALVWSVMIAGGALALALRSQARALPLLGGAAIGLLVPLGWAGTGFVLLDDFDPIAMESLSFTAPAADSLFFTLAATSLPAGFGVGLLGGVFAGALIASLGFGSFRWQSFESPGQTGRYLTGAALMGVGGVLAGGCTVGAGLSGTATLSFAAVLALAAIATGALMMHALLRPRGSSDRQRSMHPAE